MASYTPKGFYHKSLTRTKCKGFQKHHLIPVQILERASFAKLFKIARVGGFDPRDFKTNGIYLPSQEQLAIECGRPLHRGPHPIYNEMVAARLNMIENIIYHKQTSASEVASKILRMQKTLRRLLLENPRTLKLNKRDPMSKNIDFSRLDADADRIWNSIA